MEEPHAHGMYRILEQPWLYRLQRLILAPGADQTLFRRFNALLTRLPENPRILDVGCGPSSRLWPLGVHPIGLDYSLNYAWAYAAKGEPAVVGSSDALPFPKGVFDAVWSVGVFHHMPDELVHHAVREMWRVCRPGGLVVIFDAVLPEPAWRRPLAYMQRRLDRGRFMRREAHLRALLAVGQELEIERLTYTYNGLEALLAYGTARGMDIEDADKRW